MMARDSLYPDFDCPIDRRASDSVKWGTYEPDVLPMWIADLDFSAPPAVIRALHDRVAHGVFGYGKRPLPLIEVFQDRLKRLYRWTVAPESILFLPGVVSGFNLAVRSLAKPQGEVLIQTPVYPPFLKVASHSGMSMRVQELCYREGRFYGIDMDEFKKMVGIQTGSFLLCNPHNPVGRVFHKDELETMAEICLRNHVPIVSDEIHCDLTYNGHCHVPLASLSPEVERQTITLMSPSKTFNLAGLDFAIAIIPNLEMRQKFEASRKGMVSASNVLAYAAALAAYRDSQNWFDALLAYLESNRNYVMKFISERLPGFSAVEPEATFLAWIDCRQAKLASNPAKFFLNSARVALNDGKKFGPGGEGFVRLNFGCPRTRLTEGLERMAAALA